MLKVRAFVSGLCTKSKTNYIMPKKKGKQTTISEIDVSKSTASVNIPVPEKCPVSKNKEGSILITLQVKPGAKVNSITSVTDDAVSFDCSSPPVNGEANKEIIKYFAGLLKVSKADVDLKGGKSRQKVLTIRSEKLTNTSQALDILVQECGK